MAHIIERINAGKGSQEDVDLLQTVASQMQGKCFCALGEFSISAVLSGLQHFRADFNARVEK